LQSIAKLKLYRKIITFYSLSPNVKEQNRKPFKKERLSYIIIGKNNRQHFFKKTVLEDTKDIIGIGKNIMEA
jgi:hypothetical protein